MARSNKQKRTAKGSQTPQPMNRTIEKVMGKLGLLQRYGGWQVMKQWPDIVGAQYAARARAVRYDEGILYVAVEDAVWRQEVAMHVDDLMEKIHNFPFGRAVSQIRLIKGDKRTEQNGNTIA